MLAVVRHGRAVGNSQHRFLGWSDVPLDEVGRRQATLLAERLATAGIERIVSSDLNRTIETATPLADRLGLPVERDERLREIDNGEWTGRSPEEIRERWPDLWASYVGGTDVERPDGERWADVRARIRAVLDDLRTNGRRTAVVTHGGPVLLAAEWALGIDLPGNIFRGPLAVAQNSSITSIENGKLVSYSDAGHLGDLADLDVPYEPVR